MGDDVTTVKAACLPAGNVASAGLVNTNGFPGATQVIVTRACWEERSSLPPGGTTVRISGLDLRVTAFLTDVEETAALAGLVLAGSGFAAVVVVVVVAFVVGEVAVVGDFAVWEVAVVAFVVGELSPGLEAAFAPSPVPRAVGVRVGATAAAKIFADDAVEVWMSETVRPGE